jgi:ubiquinone/menaquinone biosynthesis C-methylase UbiE
MATPRTLTHDEARRCYDRIGSLQDRQAFYEDKALDQLCAASAFGEAKAVMEIGCGTGRLAERLLSEDLAADARYIGFDQSDVMIEIARQRLRRFGERGRIEKTDGTMRFPVADATIDRVASTYVFDLLSESDIRGALSEALRVLEPGGLLCVTGLTQGRSRTGRLVGRLWRLIHSLRPAVVGGCRPLELVPLLSAHWQIRLHRVVEPFGIPSEILVAAKSAEQAPG